MNALRNSMVITAAMLNLCLAVTYGNDTIPTKELQELEVIGERAWIDEDGTFNFIPSKKEKRLSNSPGSLIKAMNLPMLKENGTGISLDSGEPVEIFINGQKADDIDISTFWPMDVKKVQYLEDPRDASYRGAVHAVNFIVRRYAAGGVSRTGAYQEFPNNGIYSTSSKLVYRRMTFGAMVHGTYSREHRASARGETVYRDLYHDGDFFDSIERQEESAVTQREDNADCVVNARYTSDRLIATHTLSFGWRRNPRSGSEASGTWSGALFDSGLSSGRTSSSSVYPQISGNYYLRLTEKWHLPFRFAYVFSDNKASSANRFGESPEVCNSTRERINSLTLEADPWVRISTKIYMQMILVSSLQHFSIAYSGSADDSYVQTRFRSVAKLKLGWNPARNLNLSFDPGLDLSRWSGGGIRKISVMPTADTRVAWRLSKRHSLNLSLMFGVQPPTAEESNPVLVKSSELMWVQGNPSLGSSSFWDLYVNSSLLLEHGLSLGGGLGYRQERASVVPVYEAAPEELGGLIMSNVNAGTASHLRAAARLTWSVPRTGLSLSASPSWRYSRFSDGDGRASGYLSFRAEAKYAFGNCMADLSYAGPSSQLQMAGMERIRTQDQCDLGFSYGNGNLFLSLNVKDVFHTYTKRLRSFGSRHFYSDYTSLGTGRRLCIDISYTFGFGKKVDRSIDIQEPTEVQSGVKL